jgi:hypothetical protein
LQRAAPSCRWLGSLTLVDPLKGLRWNVGVAQKAVQAQLDRARLPGFAGQAARAILALRFMLPFP